MLVVPGAGHGPFGDVFLRFGREASEEGYRVARFETWLSPDDLDAKTDEEFRAELQAGGIDRLVLWAPAAIAEGTPDVPTDAAEALPEGDLVERPGEDHSFLTDHERVIGETLAFLK